jgi:uncharacterized membrane protein
MAHLHVVTGADEHLAHPTVRHITFSDLLDALKRGYADFSAMPSHALFLCLIYPVVAIFVAGLTMGFNTLPLAYPLMAGFALVGPIAAIGLYEMSRRREAGLEADISHTFDVLRSPSLPAIALLGLILLGIFLVWIGTAQALYQSLFGYLPPESLVTFVQNIFTTPEGWKLIVFGNALGFGFALLAFVLSAISFPLLLDRDVGILSAVSTSIRAFAKNPVTMAAWGLIIAGLLLLGSLPFFFGLAVVIPVLGHATWHLYRKVVVPDGPPIELPPKTPPKGRRYAADFPAALFPVYHKDKGKTP